MSALIFISGHGKTGTSSMVGMLNASPDFCILYEAYLCAEGGPQRRGQQLLEVFPSLIRANLGKSLSECYSKVAQEFRQLGHNYKFVGDKILLTSMSKTHQLEMATLPIIYMVRDIRTWLCKNIVVADYQAESGVAGKAASFARSLITTFTWQHCIRVSLEDFILDNATCMQRVFAFFNAEENRDCKRWWRTVGSHAVESPKGAVQWWRGHDSSQLRPSKLDTTFRLRKHEFWDDILPVFDKYYLNPAKEFPDTCIRDDLQTVAQIALRHKDLNLEDLYETVQSVSFGSGIFGAMGHRSSNPHVKPYSINRYK